ncbi:hypothetical protein PaecuDRAFT_4176 [Paenibacillus curdlanolyticus YK9]|uniref:Uncharacterized protein n=1 Tax=Paenibacillus curdlanolyticus YK9 TaxID=717606 RepID=E0IET5_9BACL|nr:hypothetical protein [Paenibacillus curdlanolyticus]EFM09173.1 hypothetical protein PaecuDRAFT_4176 [Paenibacillus curdlanolyticus YK9]
MKPAPIVAERSAVVIFPDAPWRSSAFKPLIAQLASKHPLLWVTDQPELALQGAPASVSALALQELDQVPWGQTSAMLLHPCWTVTALPLRPRLIGAWMAIDAQEGSLPAKWRAVLTGEASFVLSLSEPYYLDLSFRRDGVFVLDGADETSDWFALQAVLWAADGTDPCSLARLQQQRREAAYRERLATAADATLAFYRSVYLYLLGDMAQAERELLAAFEQAVLGGGDHALAGVYRCRSAIQAAQGNVEKAALTYESSAATDSERMQADELRQLIANGETAMAAAALLRLNDDHRQAIERLERLCATWDSAAKELRAAADAPEDAGQTIKRAVRPAGRQAGTGASEAATERQGIESHPLAAGGNAAQEGTENQTVRRKDYSSALAAKRELAERMLLDSLLQAGKMRAAYERIAPETLASVKDRCEYALLQSIVQLVDGNRRGAITALLRATELQHEAIGSLTELVRLDAAVQRLANGTVEDAPSRGSDGKAAADGTPGGGGS